MLSCNSFLKDDVRIEKVPQNDIDSISLNQEGIIEIDKADYFIVESNGRDIGTVRKDIASFVQNNIPIDKKLRYYEVLFYKKSDEINMKEIKQYSYDKRYKIFMHNRKDLISFYRWEYGKLTKVHN